MHIIVRDNGPGISTSIAETMFDPRQTTKRELGAGMGLYASRNMLVAVGGALECIEHYMWAGSTFRLRLPIVLSTVEAAQPPP